MGKFLIAVLLLAIAGEASAQQFECKNCIPAGQQRFTVVNRMGPFRQRSAVTVCTGPDCPAGAPAATGAVPALVPMVAGGCVNGQCPAPATAGPVWRPFGGRFRR